MWPGGARAAAAFTFDLDAEEVWLADDPANVSKPGVLSQGAYGPKIALPRILELLDRHGVDATFFVPGRVAERYPDRVRAIVEAGHELAHHGLTHRAPSALGREDEETELVEAKRILASFGVEIAGYRSPSLDLSPHTLELLRAHGFRYSSNLMDDDRPYLHEGEGPVEIPVHWMLDDAPHFWFDVDTWAKRIAPAAEVRSIWLEEFEGITRFGGCTVFISHPQIIGRPGRLAMLEDVVRAVRAREDVWVAPCRAIAEAAGR
ncbi:MAG TPA: polysaccharide deacetylase [Actinomycetota bacterium]|nr:polysaccharide deacetylase [Actinomycetota bacterium]